VLEAKSHV